MVIELLPIDSGIGALALPETAGVPFMVRVAVRSVTVGVTAHVVVFTETK
jgi:hypothetical protein